MITLAVASAFAILASQLSDLTGGEDGLNYRLPAVLRPSFPPGRRQPVRGAPERPPARLLPGLLRLAWRCSWLLLRVVNSPFGRVLQAIRENPFRAEAIGYRTVLYRTLANCISAAVAALAGALLALWSARPTPTPRSPSTSWSTSC